MAEPIKTIIHDLVYYHAILEEYKSKAYFVDSDKMAYDIKVILDLELDRTKDLKVIAVGCGNGESDEPIIDNLLTKHPSIRYIAVDPAVDKLAQFKQLVEYNKDKWKNVVFDFHAITIEEYLETSEAEHYDLIVATHAAYHFKDVENTMIELYNCLVKGGILLSTMCDGNRMKLLSQIGQYYKDPLYHFIGTSDIEKIMKRNVSNIRNKDTSSEYRIDVTESFDEESQAGCHMMDFITTVYKFNETCTPKIKKTIREYLLNECCQKEGNKLIFSTSVTASFFFKD
ncbi:histamine N-methyltransferase-like [Saccoglossus kowalevskii]